MSTAACDVTGAGSCISVSLLRKQAALRRFFFFFFNDPATPEISPLPLPDALPISQDGWGGSAQFTYQNTLLGAPVTAAAGLDYTGATLRHRIGNRDLNGQTLTKEDNAAFQPETRSEEHTSELQSQSNLVCRPLLEK